MAGAAVPVVPGTKQFPLNLPRTYEGMSVMGFNASNWLGNSISGLGTYLTLFDKGFPHLRAMLMSCVGEGMTKASVEVVSTILITVFVLPIFCALSALYNIVAGGIKGGMGLVNYLAEKRKASELDGEDEESREIDAPKYIQLFREATDHFCFVGMDCMGLFTRGIYLFSGAFAFSAFDDGNVAGAFHKYEGEILDGTLYEKGRVWGQEHGWLKAPEGSEGGGGSGESVGVGGAGEGSGGSEGSGGGEFVQVE